MEGLIARHEEDAQSLHRIDRLGAVMLIDNSECMETPSLTIFKQRIPFHPYP